MYTRKESLTGYTRRSTLGKKDAGHALNSKEAQKVLRDIFTKKPDLNVLCFTRSAADNTTLTSSGKVKVVKHPIWTRMPLPLGEFVASAKNLARLAIDKVNTVVSHPVDRDMLVGAVTKKLPAENDAAREALEATTFQSFQSVQDTMGKVNADLFGLRSLIAAKYGILSSFEVPLVADQAQEFYLTRVEPMLISYQPFDEHQTLPTVFSDKEALFALRDLFGFMFGDEKIFRRKDSFYYGPGAVTVSDDLKHSTVKNLCDKMCGVNLTSNVTLRIRSFLEDSLCDAITKVSGERLDNGVFVAYDDGWSVPDRPLSFVTPKYMQVPKDATKNRSIIVPTPLSRAAAKAVDEAIQRVLAKFLDWDDSVQPDLNRTAAFLGSFSNPRLATVDYSNASDSISFGLVCFLFSHPRARWFLQLLIQTRNATYMAKDGSVHILQSMSGMGEQFTFKLETLIFMMLKIFCEAPNGLHFRDRNLSWDKIPKRGGGYVTSADLSSKEFLVCNPYAVFGWSKSEPHGLDRDLAEAIVFLKRTRAFGDDVVTAASDSSLLALSRFMGRLGIMLNEEKSYGGYSLPFRESCGSDFLDGVYVRGFYLKTREPTLSDFIRLCNFYTCYYGITDEELRKQPIYKWVVKRVKLEQIQVGYDLWYNAQPEAAKLPIPRDQQIAKLMLGRETRDWFPRVKLLLPLFEGAETRCRVDLYRIPTDWLVTRADPTRLPKYRYRSFTLKQKGVSTKVTDYDMTILSLVGPWEDPDRWTPVSYLDDSSGRTFFDTKRALYGDTFESLSDDFLKNHLSEALGR